MLVGSVCPSSMSSLNSGCTCWAALCATAQRASGTTSAIANSIVKLVRQGYGYKPLHHSLLTCRTIERTKSRPLASGAVSLHGAALLLAVLVLLGAWVLSFAGGNGYAPRKYGSTSHSHLFSISIMVGLFGSLVLDPLYPLMKRWTHWPQAFLGRPANQELSVLAL